MLTFLDYSTNGLHKEIHQYPSEFAPFSIEFGPNFTVFEGKETKILKIHVRFFKIQITFNTTGLLPKSELVTLSELREKFEKPKSIFFDKKKRFREEHGFAL